MSQKGRKELEQALVALKKENTKENINHFMKIMEECEFLIPAVLPPDTDPRIMKQLAQAGGKQISIPKGLSPRPAILENKEGKHFLPLFTSDEQVRKGGKQHPITLSLPFRACMELMAREKEICGVVLNVFDHNITLNFDKSKKKEPEKKEVKLTEPQLHAVLRQQLEAAVLPAALFEQKEGLIEDIRERQGEVFVEIYQEIYPEQVKCPYSADEFEVMALNIREDLSVLRVAMPDNKLVPGTCPMVLISWNPVGKKLRYFGIVKGKSGEESHIIEALEDGSKKDFGEAPSEGSELQFMIDVNEK